MSETTPDFDGRAWHDCYIRRLEIVAGEPDEDDWVSDLVLDIDYITEWPTSEQPASFLVAPARLTFHGVTGLRINLEPIEPDFRTAIHLLSIDHIERERLTEQKVFLDRPYYRWALVLNLPPSGLIEFGAWGWTQTLLAEPIRTHRQHLTRSERGKLIGG